LPCTEFRISKTIATRDWFSCWSNTQEEFHSKEACNCGFAKSQLDDEVVEATGPPAHTCGAGQVPHDSHMGELSFQEDLCEHPAISARVEKEHLMLMLKAVRRRGGLVGTAQHLNLTSIAEMTQPLLLNIIEFLADSPWDVVSLCSLTLFSMAAHAKPFANRLWSTLFIRKWPAIYECMRFHGVACWQSLYRDTKRGKTECVLEVYHRAKKQGFIMSAMAAVISYDSTQNSYLATYISRRNVIPEVIPLSEENRLRFVPSFARKLLPELNGPNTAVSTSYLYRVLEGTNGKLCPGFAVELQWMMQAGSPFGWWYAEIESLQHDQQGNPREASLIFRQFPPHSPWYRMQVTLGVAEKRPCSLGGWVGGLHVLSSEERRRWLTFLPADL